MFILKITTMCSHEIINLLSQHRIPGRSHFPQPLTRHQLLSLLKASQPPRLDGDAFSPSKLDSELTNLEAQGEILSGVGKRFCMASPTLLIDHENQTTELLFVGDRAYLRLAHQILETKQPIHQTRLRPRLRDVQRIQSTLESTGIGLLTVQKSVEYLPAPQLPEPWTVRGAEWSGNPCNLLQTSGYVQGYHPGDKSQGDRWLDVTPQPRDLPSLLQLPDGVFLWMQHGHFFEISPDAACLAMFALDQQVSQPLKLAWDDAPGRLDLRCVRLPRAYAQLIWRLSNPSPEHNRIRYVDPQNQPRVKAALERLGCVLV
jgi:hypothetical protein